MKRTPTTYTTLDSMAREIRLPRTAEAVEMLGRFVARVQDGTASKSCDENRRLRADVRRLRRALRAIRGVFAPVAAMYDGKHRVACLCFINYIDAALAPRRRKGR